MPPEPAARDGCAATFTAFNPISLVSSTVPINPPPSKATLNLRGKS